MRGGPPYVRKEMEEIREILARNNFYFKKKFGQNFLTDPNLLGAIVRDAGVVMATNAGYVISLTTIITLITILYSYPDQVFGIFTNDPSVISVIKVLLFFVLADLFIDALPLNINGALNGRGDVKIPTLNQVISFLGVRVSACYFFAFTLDMGLKGLPIGLACGGLSSLILNTLRFGYLAHRDKKEGLH